MTVSSKPKPLSSYGVSMSASRNGHVCEPGFLNDDEIRAFEEHLLIQKSPGIKMLINRMRALDAALIQLRKDLRKFTPKEYHKSYVTSDDTRMYILMKYISIELKLEYAKFMVEHHIGSFYPAVASTHLAPRPKWLALARAWQRRHRDERAEEARVDSSARRTPAARKVVAGVSSRRPIKPTRQTKVGIGS